MSQTTLKPNQAMVLSQLYTNEIQPSALLDALISTPRQCFVPAHLAACAHMDDDLAMGENRYMLAPLDQARLLQAADILPHHRVLDIACGMGYSTAVIARLAQEAIGLDSSALFKQHAQACFTQLGITNARVEITQNIAAGCPSLAPFDRIIINGSLSSIPDSLSSQLNEGGMMVFVQAISEPRPGVHGMGRLTIATRVNMRLRIRQTWECSVPLLKEFNQPQGFTFGAL